MKTLIYPLRPLLQSRLTLLFFTGFVSTLLLALMLNTISSTAAKAQTTENVSGTVRFVSSTGNDAGNDCSLSNNPCKTIQHALDVALESDEIHVATGTYSGTMNAFIPDVGEVAATIILTKNLTALLGGYSSDFDSRDLAQTATTLDASGGSVNWIIFASGVATLIDGFKMSGVENISAAQRGAVRVDAGNAIFSHNQIVGNQSANRGAGFMITGGSPQIVSNSILSNSAAEGGAIYILTGTVTISDNLIAGNVAQSGDGGGIYIAGGAVLIANNTIAQNQAISGTTGRGGGIVVRSGEILGILGNQIYGNQSADGGSAIESNVGTRVESNFIHHNQVLFAGAAVLIEQSDLPIVLINNLVYKNLGSCITLRDFNTAQIINNTSHQNQYVSFGGPGNGIDVNASITPTRPFTATIINNLLTNNAQCGIEAYNGIVLASDYNDLFNNKKDYCNLAQDAKGTHDLNGDPHYMNASLDNYRPIPGGAAVDQGTATNAPSVDIYGALRPYENGVDIGAIEAGPAYLYLPTIHR